VNIILCPVFIHFFGLKGAAIATVTGRSAGVLYQCYHLFRGDGLLKFTLKYFIPRPETLRTIIHLSWPAAFQFVITSGSWIFLIRLIAETGGTSASAGSQIAFRNLMFFILPAWGMSNAAATLVGQNLGAKHIQRAEKSVFLIAKYNVIFMSMVTILFVFFARPIISIFTSDPDVLDFGIQAMRIIGAGFIFYGIGMVMIQALNGAGDTRTPTIINFFGFWMFQIPLAYLLTHLTGLGVTGAMIAIPAAESLIALIALYFFRKGSWKKIEV